MNVPKIRTTEGLKPLTILPDKALVEGFLYSDAPADDIDLVRLLEYAEPDAKKNGAILRQCLEGKARLLPVYPGNNEAPPNKATLIGDILDGALYLVL